MKTITNYFKTIKIQSEVSKKHTQPFIKKLDYLKMTGEFELVITDKGLTLYDMEGNGIYTQDEKGNMYSLMF